MKSFDKLMRKTLERCLGGPISDASSTQASTGVQDGGLGMRRFVDLANPAFVASRVELRPMKMSLANSLVNLGMDIDLLHDLYDEAQSRT